MEIEETIQRLELIDDKMKFQSNPMWLGVRPAITILERVKRLEKKVQNPEFGRGCPRSMRCNERKKFAKRVVGFLKTGEEW